MKNTLSCFLSVFIISFLRQVVHSESHGQSAFRNLEIVGGKNTTIEQHPYQVALILLKNLTTKNLICGGTIISPRFILTAAHCAKELLYSSKHSIDEFHVRVGSTYDDNGGTLYKITRMVAHPLFSLDALDFDVGFIELQSNITLDGKTSKAISLPPLGTSAPVPAGTNVTVTGWGCQIINDNPIITNQLMEVTIPTITNADCAKEYKEDEAITPRMICAGLPQGGKGACYGDSGGPAVDSSSGVQLGIVSFTTYKGCAFPGYATVFANLTDPDIRRWIKKNTGV